MTCMIVANWFYFYTKYIDNLQFVLLFALLTCLFYWNYSRLWIFFKKCRVNNCQRFEMNLLLHLFFLPMAAVAESAQYTGKLCSVITRFTLIISRFKSVSQIIAISISVLNYSNFPSVNGLL